MTMQYVTESLLVPIIVGLVGYFNASDFVENGIRTLPTQAYPYFALILVNGRSTGSSGAKCDALANQSVRLIYRKNEYIGLFIRIQSLDECGDI